MRTECHKNRSKTIQTITKILFFEKKLKSVAGIGNCLVTKVGFLTKILYRLFSTNSFNQLIGL